MKRLMFINIKTTVKTKKSDIPNFFKSIKTSGMQQLMLAKYLNLDWWVLR